MSFENVRVYTNCDDALIVWKTKEPIPECRGFALQREHRGNGAAPASSFVPTWVGFEGQEHKPGERRPSTEWPIQRFIWTDYLVNLGNELRYRVIPMIGSKDHMDPAPKDQCSPWTDWVRVGTGQTPGFQAYFNRGVIPAQWLARFRGKDEKKLLGQDINRKGAKNRDFLGGELRRAMLRLLHQAKDDGVEIHAALYELNDPELIDALKALGTKCHLILGSGAYKGPDKKHHTPAIPDENKDVREDLRQNSSIDLRDRIVRSPHFAHNKVVIFSDSSGLPTSVWTGSTNWTVTGLCTQTNNGLLVESRPLAEAYLRRWNELAEAGDGYPESLAQEGSTPSVETIEDAQVTVWNTPTIGRVDLADARSRIQAAKQGILFLMLNPGPRETLLDAILGLDPDKIFIHGVLNQDPGGDKDPKIIFTHKGHALPPVSLPIALPKALSTAGRRWFGSEFTFNMIMVHSKVIVIDPFGARPVVLTGSHNLGPKASSKNDDNLVIVENAPGLAQEYAVNVLGIYGHYKWRYNQYLKKQGTDKEKSLSPQYDGNKDNDQWQHWYESGASLREIDFLLGV